MVRSGVVVFPLRVVTTCCSVFWISVEEFLEQLRNGTGSFLFDFLEGVPCRPRGSVVEFLWVETFGLLESSLKSSYY